MGVDPVYERLLQHAGFIPDYVESHKSVIYILEPQLHIVYCNAHWDEFALANGGYKLQRALIKGKCALDAIPEPLKSFYRDGFQRVRETSHSWEHEFECSSADLYRTFRMRVTRLAGNHLLIENSLSVEKPHGTDRLATASAAHIYTTADGIVTMCMHCRRTKRAAGFPERLNELADMVWDWVPSFVQNPPERVSHGVCRMCYPRFFEHARS